ncbi:uncharacterized protein [Montipora capricornis]|uniref:uncharacterized protein n=1 Tax=Montipora capricornis TaxID=246305 RepID=UPI0035F1E459
MKMIFLILVWETLTQTQCIVSYFTLEDVQGPDSIWGSRTLLHLECDDESDDTVEDPDYVQPDLHKDSCSSIRTRSQHEQIASRDAIVTEVDQNPISWVVLSFPVMT